MGKISTPVFTKVFAAGETYTFTGKEGYNKVAIQWISGSPTILGTGKLGTNDSSAITLSSDLPGLTLVGDDQITGVVLTAADGSFALVCNS